MTGYRNKLPTRSTSAEVDAFLRNVASVTPVGRTKTRGRLLFAMDATASRESANGRRGTVSPPTDPRKADDSCATKPDSSICCQHSLRLPSGPSRPQPASSSETHASRKRMKPLPSRLGVATQCPQGES